MKLCLACQGSGEVAMGIGLHQAERLNPKAVNDLGLVWIVDPNPLVPLWGIALCGWCRGTGMDPSNKGVAA